MMTYRKLSADGAGRLIVAYLREHMPEPGTDVRTDRDPARDVESGDRLNSYYTGRDGQGAWGPGLGGRIADALGIDVTAPPSDAALARLFECKRASDGKEWPGAHANRTISGVDFTASPDKSVTLAAEFAATKAEQALIWHAIQQANDRAMAFIGKEIGVARRGKGGEGWTEEGEVAWVSFRHYAARPAMHIQDGAGGATASVEIPIPGDPQAHIHNPVFNAVATESGHLGSLDTARITKVTSHLFGAYFQAELAQQLRGLGVRVRPDERGKAIVIESIPRSVCDAFSKRSHQAEAQAKAFVKRQGGDWNTMSAEQKFRVLYQANLAYRSKKYTGTNDREIWREQAAELGWKHSTVLTGDVGQELPDPERYEKAYEIAARLIADEFRTAAVLDRDVFRMHAAHALIATGINGRRDVDHVADMIESRGIEIDGERVGFVIREQDRKVRIATLRQVAIETEMGDLAGLASRTREGALSDEAITRAIAGSGLDFDRDPDHGRAQLAAIYALGRAGGLGFLTGVAGSGKTTLLRPLVSAWKEDGRNLIGAAIAWRQADALKDAGIARTLALTPLLDGIAKGTLDVSRDTVLVLDEVSQIAPRQLLEILRLQKEVGFSVRLLGDRQQAQAIEAGDSVEILERVLPPEARPELLSTIRQKSARAREIAGLFRSPGRQLEVSEEEQKAKDTARAREAIDMKRRDGTFSLVGGDHAQVVAELADFYLRRRDMLRASGSKRGITMSAPTNEDVLALSLAVRERLRARNEIGKEEIIRAAIDQRGEIYDLPISKGDRVRLFSRMQCQVTRADGRGWRWRDLGSNGDFVDVEGWNDKGIVLKNTRGVTGMVPWERLADRETGRIRLGPGHAMTIDSAQGITSDEHINAMPRGSSSVTGFTAYVAESRHVHTCWTRVAEAPVREAESFSRPLGDATPVTLENLLDRIAGDMGRHEYKSLAIDLEKVRLRYEENTTRWIRQSHDNEAARQQGKTPGAGFRSRMAAREVTAVPQEKWDDIDRTLRRMAFQTQDVAEKLERVVGEKRRQQEQAEKQRREEQVRERDRRPTRSAGREI